MLFVILFTYSVGQATELRFIGEVNFPTGEIFQGTRLGGLSGAAYDSLQKKLLVISDDKSNARFYEFEMELEEKKFQLKPSKIVSLRANPGLGFKKETTDFEGVALLKNGDVLVSSEEWKNPKSLLQFSRDGNLVSEWPVPEKFVPPRGNWGVRDNSAFEALSVTKDGETVFLGAEEALLQDGPTSSKEEGSFVRIIRYKKATSQNKVLSEVAYQLEKFKVTNFLGAVGGSNGLVDIAAIDENNFYAMERSFLPVSNKVRILIFKCVIDEKTTDVSIYPSLKKVSFKSVEKTLVADLDDFTAQMNPPRLDNIEGLTFGPVLPNGHESLIVVSDNNFNWLQRTQFVAFELISK